MKAVRVDLFAIALTLILAALLGWAMGARAAVTLEEARRLARLTPADMKPFWSRGDYNAQTVSGRYFRQAYTLQLKSKTREAISLYKKAIDADTTCMAAYWNLGLCYESLKMWKEAESLYKESTEIYPISHNFWQHLANVEFHLGKPKEAVQAINKMIEK